jgi:sulfate permease, SulP family
VKKLVDYLQRLELKKDDQIIQQGEIADTIFFIETGQVTVWLESPDQPLMRLETILGGRVVGELGFYLSIPRTASVVVDKPSVVYSLSRQQLQVMEASDPDIARLFHQVIAHLLCERVVLITRLADALQH